MTMRQPTSFPQHQGSAPAYGASGYGAPAFGGPPPAPTAGPHPDLAKLRLMAGASVLLGLATGVPGLVLAVLALRLGTRIRAQGQAVPGGAPALQQVNGWRIVAGFGIVCGIIGTISVLIGLLPAMAGPAAH